MDHDTATKIARMHRLEARAEAHHKRALESGNTRLGFRAAKLMEAVNAKMALLMGAELATYHDR